MSVNTGVAQGVNHGLGEILPPALQASLKVRPRCSPSLTSLSIIQYNIDGGKSAAFACQVCMTLMKP